MGQFDQAFHDVERFRYCEASSGQEHDPQGERAFPLEVYGMVSHARLQMEFEYSEELHSRAEVESLAGDFMATLRALIGHCMSSDAGGFTASDFSDFSWGEEQLGAITGAIRKVQAEATEGEGS